MTLRLRTSLLKLLPLHRPLVRLRARPRLRARRLLSAPRFRRG